MRLTRYTWMERVMTPEPRDPGSSIRLKQVRDVGETVHCQPAGRTLAPPAGEMERVLGHVNDISLVRDDHSYALDRIPYLPLEDQPEFGAFGVIVRLRFRIERRELAVVAVNKLC